MARFIVLFALAICALLPLNTFAQSYNATAAAISAANDLTVLNYALTLENLEATFYAQGLATFTAAQFTAGSFNLTTYQMLQIIAAHEAQHVVTLTTVINSAAPGQAAPPCTYNFATALASPAAFIATALALETGGQQAYDGALNGITNPAYAAAAATIATVEGRHAAYLSLIQAAPQVPFPAAFDNATLPAAIAAIIAPFIVSCPYNITLPTVRPTGVTLGTNGVVATGSLPASYTAQQQTNDITALNYALTLEKLEAAFYNYALATFTAAQFTAAGFPAYYYTYSQLIQSHENTHVAALTAVITARGGSPVPNCTYNFAAITTVQAYLTVAQILENTGVQAYDGAANTITDTALQQVAATIVTVEARHAAFLNLANNASAFPNTFDNATLPADIIARVLATGLIASCPYTPVGPVVITPNVLAVTSVRGDPSFVGFNGQSFQVHGIPNRYFNLLSTPSVQFNALFRMLVDGESMTAGQMKAARVTRQLQSAKHSKAAALSLHPLPLTTAYSHEGTFLAEMGLKLSGVQVFAAAGAYATGFSSVTVNGKAVSVSSAAVEVASGMYVTLSTPSVLTVDTPTVSFTLVNADHFFNIEQATLNQPHTADSLMDGLLGQTADSEWKVQSTKEFKQHMVYDYLVADMDAFSDDFVSNVYDAKK